MKGIVILALLVATFLGGYHLGKQGAFDNLDSDKAVQFASKAFDALKKLAQGEKTPDPAPQKRDAVAPPAGLQPAQISNSRGENRPADGITLQINGKTYVVCERPR